VRFTGRYSVDFPVYYRNTRNFLEDPHTLYDRDAALTPSSYLYPPLSVLLFVPFVSFGESTAFTLFQLGNAAALALATVLILRVRRSLFPDGERHRAYGAFFVLLVVTSGPACGGFALGQITPILLALSVGAVYLSHRGRPVLAGLALSMACWTKIYPTLLLIAMLVSRPHRKAAGMTILFGALLPVAMLWLIPFGLYTRYFLELLPAFSSEIQIHADNHSFVAVLARLQLPPSQWTSWNVVGVAPWIKAVNFAVLVLGIAFLSCRRVRNAHDPLLVALFALCFISVVAPLGWGHSFLLSVPLAAYCAVFPAPGGGRAAAAFAWLLWLVPGHMSIVESAPLAMKALQFLRYPAALAIALAVGARRLVAADARTP
jgi:hypothetical protein